jgi:hypothetical protein
MTKPAQPIVVTPPEGYDFDSPTLERSPVTLEELRHLELAAGWTAADAAILGRIGVLIRDDAEAIVDSWRSVIGKQPELARWFIGPDGEPDEQYKSRVKKRFVQWIHDVCFRPHDQSWLDYQDEIGKRHTPLKKNRTDAAATPAWVPLRYVIAFTSIVLTSIGSFAARRGVTGEELEHFQHAWAKAIRLEIALWSRPYTHEGLW